MAAVECSRVWVVISAALAAGLLALGAVDPAEAAFPGKNGRIFFETARDDGRTNVYSMNDDGTRASSLPRSSVAIADTNPAVSAGGARVAFEHARDIWIMDHDGTDPRPVTTDGGAADDLQPAWSPDGTKIAFYRITSSARDIYVINADGSNLRQLTTATTQDSDPAWSPDGTKIAYVVCCQNIWVMNADGTGQANLTGASAYPGVAGGSTEPNWSPDGARLVFSGGPACEFSCTGRDIYTMGVTGGGATNLTPTPDNHYQPVFSPDGSRIAFVSNTIDGPNHDVYTMPATGSAPTNITNDAAMDANPDWSVPSPNAAPAISALRPAPNAAIRDRTPLVSATVTDDRTDLAKSNLQLFVDGRRTTAFTYLTTTNRLTYTSRPLRIGRHTARIIATDREGLAAYRTWSFRIQ